jgi:hypothetical protein
MTLSGYLGALRKLLLAEPLPADDAAGPADSVRPSAPLPPSLLLPHRASPAQVRPSIEAQHRALRLTEASNQTTPSASDHSSAPPSGCGSRCGEPDAPHSAEAAAMGEADGEAAAGEAPSGGDVGHAPPPEHV